MIEAMFLIAIFNVFLLYGLGLFGVIHSGILFSISARAYSFETMRNRASTMTFRYGPGARGYNPIHHMCMGYRYHYVTDETNQNDAIRASARPIVIGFNREPVNASGGSAVVMHNENAFTDIQRGQRNQTVEVHPAWLMIGYGLCMNAQCGQD